MIEALYANSEDWLKYAIQINLLHAKKMDQIALLQSALMDTKIQRALEEVAAFHSTRISSHKDPTLPIQQLLFLLDLGFDTSIPQLQSAIDQILKHQDDNGVYFSMINVPKQFGGTGEDGFSWCLCDAPNLMIALIKAGVSYEEHIKRGVEYLVSLCRENGFPCVASPELGRFRGPGKKDDCCPYATLIMTDLLSYLPEYRDASIAKASSQALLDLWSTSREQHPYLFHMGTDFRKLKAPSCWYDIVSVAGVLSKFPFNHSDPRFLEMIDLIKSKQRDDGFFVPESIYMKMKDWDFGQKKTASPYLTYLCLQILDRIGQPI